MSKPPGQRSGRLSLVSPAGDVGFYAQRAWEGPVLLLGSADGRVAFELAARGVEVVAVEPADGMARAAEARRAAERPEVAGRVQLVHGDPRSLRLRERFGAVAAPHNALALYGTLEDVDALLETARLHLRPQGTLVFDLRNPAAPLRVRPHFRPGDGPDEPLMSPPPLTFVPHLHERARAAQHEGLRRMKVRAFTLEEVDEALADAGFTPLERFGDFAGKPLDPGDPVQVVVAAKAD
ncbi:MAG: class I SAM-dependent methyltransferase [Deltaproteobacteria bacterium]|nr:class I SAM-dependent methyltransferase [Deltaproteobacteria bacterium]